MISRKQLQHICKLYNITPSKSAGQHFLLDDRVVGAAVDAARVSDSDTVVEVGPGLGVLTEALLERAGQVIALETDAALCDFLRAKFSPAPKLNLVQGDALGFSPAAYHLSAYKVVANIPYNITSPLLQLFMEAVPRPNSLTVLVQREVAQRVCAKPGEMSLLSLSIQLYGKPSIVRTVERQSFWPAPKVQSAILHVDNILTQSQLEQRLGGENGITERFFWRTARIGFSGRRKQLHNTLSAGFRVESEDVKEVLVRLGLRQDIRAQALSVDEWIALAKEMKNHFNLLP